MKRLTRNLKVCETLVTFYYEDKIYTKNVLFPNPLSKKEVESFLDLIFPGSKILKAELQETKEAFISLPLTLLLNVSEEGVAEIVKYRNNVEVSEWLFKKLKQFTMMNMRE